jgi:predicted MFS family arabinose efflux permease
MQGRMNSVMRFIVRGVMPIGSLLGGALATWVGLGTTMWIAVAIGLFAFVPVLCSPVRQLRELPESTASGPAAEVA